MADNVSTEGLKRMEIVCIETFKVYDFCFQSERRENNCFPLAGFRSDYASCKIEPDEIVSSRSAITGASCPLIWRSKPDEDGRAQVTLGITITATATITDEAGNTCTQAGEFGFTKTVVLCAPTGTQINCFIPNFSCGPCMLMGTQVCCAFDLCIVIQSLALVKLLVPSCGFCTPTVCEQVSPGPPFVCQPELFPPQCPDDNCNCNR